jgi:hypothetical protein
VDDQLIGPPVYLQGNNVRCPVDRGKGGPQRNKVEKIKTFVPEGKGNIVQQSPY